MLVLRKSQKSKVLLEMLISNFFFCFKYFAENVSKFRKVVLNGVLVLFREGFFCVFVCLGFFSFVFFLLKNKFPERFMSQGCISGHSIYLTNSDLSRHSTINSQPSASITSSSHIFLDSDFCTRILIVDCGITVHHVSIYIKYLIS